MRRRFALGASILLLTLAAGPAVAQLTLFDSPGSNASAIGRVADGATNTVFTVDASTGAVVRVSGDAVRLTSGSASSPTITIVCGNSNACRDDDVRVVIVAGAPSGGRASIVSFSVSNLSGTTYNSGSAPPEGASLDFLLNPLGRSSITSFRLGLRVSVPTTGATGLSTLPWTVTVSHF